MLRFAIVFAICFAISTTSWELLVKNRLYHCSDDSAFGYLTPGNWIHGEVVTVEQVRSSATLSDSDQQLRGWSEFRFNLLWAASLAVTIGISAAVSRRSGSRRRLPELIRYRFPRSP